MNFRRIIKNLMKPRQGIFRPFRDCDKEDDHKWVYDENNIHNELCEECGLLKTTWIMAAACKGLLCKDLIGRGYCK